jgi:hypothetical protein
MPFSNNMVAAPPQFYDLILNLRTARTTAVGKVEKSPTAQLDLFVALRLCTKHYRFGYSHISDYGSMDAVWICKVVLSRDGSIIFAAVLDSLGKIIVGHSNSGELNNEKEIKASRFYGTHILPVITRINNKNRSQLFDIRLTKRTHLSVTVIGQENEKWLGISYCKYE